MRGGPGGPPRGGPGQRGRGGQGQRGGRSAEPLKFDTEFDFETSNAQFAKDDIEKELKNLSLSKPFYFDILLSCRYLVFTVLLV